MTTEQPTTVAQGETTKHVATSLLLSFFSFIQIKASIHFNFEEKTIVKSIYSLLALPLPVHLRDMHRRNRNIHGLPPGLLSQRYHCC